MKLTCPHCHTAFPAVAATEDQAARQLFGKLQQRPDIAGAIIPYLGLFKPRRQTLRWSRALLLTEQVLALDWPHPVLRQALVDTVAALREKQQSDSWRPLANHNYLNSVCASINSSATPVKTPASGAEPAQRPVSAAAQALIDLERMKNG